MMPLLLLALLAAIPAPEASAPETPAQAVPAQTPYQDDLDGLVGAIKRTAKSAEALAPLYRLQDLEELVGVASWEQAMRTAIGLVRHPLVKAHAQQMLATLEERRGATDAAAAARASLGFVEQWWVVGPFDNEGRKGFAEVYAPEREKSFDPARTYPGKERQVGWRRADALVKEGVVPLDGLVRPDVNAIAYAHAAIELDREAALALRVGSSGAVKIWVDGLLVLTRDVYRPLRFDQDAAGVRLERGHHQILVKVGATSGAWAFQLRLTRPDGSPAAFKPCANTEPGTRARPSLISVARLQPLLHDRALAEYLLHIAPDDPDEQTAERVMAAACAKGQVAVGGAAQERPERSTLARTLEDKAREDRLARGAACFLRLAEMSTESNDRLAALEHAREAARAAGDARLQARILAALGDVYASGRRDRRASELWQEALRLDTGHFPAALQSAEQLADRGLLSAGERMAQDWLARLPDVPKVFFTYSRLCERLGKRQRAEEALSPLARVFPQDPQLLRERASFARTKGDSGRALEALGLLAERHPEQIVQRMDLAELLEGAGRGAEAERTLRAVTDQVPDEPLAWEKLGRLLVRLGRKTEALAALRRALELKPQSPEVRELAERLEPQPGSKDLARQFARDVRTLARAAAQRAWPGESRAILLDQKITRIHGNGLSEVYVQRIIKVLDDRGAREEAEQDVRYTPDTQSVEVRAARILKPSGEVWEAVSRDDRSVSEPWYGLYYDVRALIVQLDRLEPGDVIDFEYVVQDVGRRNLMADYFGDLHFFQEESPRQESLYALLAPADRPLYFNPLKLAGVRHSESVRGAERYYEWRAADVPKVELEPGMPGWSEAAAYLHVSTYRTWDDVGRWYWGLVREQLAANPAMKTALARALAGAHGERDRLRAVHNLVVHATRYVGLEFGIHGYKPYRTTQIWERKFGDCKDKASLLVVLLREAGIPAQLVLVRTRHGGDLVETPASLAIFDHAIAYVPKYDLWLDGTAEFSGTAELPAQDQGVLVLRVADGESRLVRTPVYPPSSNRVWRRERVQVAGSGAAQVDEHLILSGQAAPEWREHYQAAGERRERYEKAWNGRQPGAHVVRVEMPGIETLEQPVEVRAQIEAPRLGRALGTALAWPATARESELARSYARLSERKYDLVLGYPWAQDERVEYALPDGWKPVRLPESRKLETPFGSFELTAETQGSKVIIVSRLQVIHYRIGRDEYARFRKFLLDADAAFNQEVLAGPAAPVSSPTSSTSSPVAR